MRSIFTILMAVISALLFWSCTNSTNHSQTINFRGKTFEVYTVNDPSSIQFYLNDSSGNKLNNFAALKDHIAQKGNQLAFATNGGMFTPDFNPLGLYIENDSLHNPLNLDSANGNFFLMPNGVFGINHDNIPFVITSSKLAYEKDNFKYATQSGPMLLIDEQIHPAFREGSKNLYIRNGVGITDEGKVVFAISNQKTNFYDFASLFKEQLKCKNALYLDGAISKMFYPETGRNEDGSFGVMIAVVK